MSLGDIKNYVYRRTKLNSTSFPAADMLIAVNSAYEHVNTIIRQWTSNYDPTRFTSGDLSTGTLAPVFNSRFHELIPLWIVYQYFNDNDKPGAVGIYNREILPKEAELIRFYGLRNYKIFTVTIASPGVFTRVNHGLYSGDKIIFETTGALPTGLSAETWYYVVQPTGDTFQVAATKDGTAINTSGTQSGTHYYSIERQGRINVSTDSNK